MGLSCLDDAKLKVLSHSLTNYRGRFESSSMPMRGPLNIQRSDSADNGSFGAGRTSGPLSGLAPNRGSSGSEKSALKLPVFAAAPSLLSEPTTSAKISTLALVRSYFMSIFLPTFLFENARSVAATLIPLLAHAVIDGSYLAEIGAVTAPISPPPNPIIPHTNHSISNNTGGGGSPSSVGEAGDQFMGILIAMVSLGTVLANVPCGMLAHRVSLRTVLLLTGFLHVVSTCGLVTAMYMGSYNVVYATLVVASLTWGAAFSPLSVGRLLFVQHSLSVDLRPRLMSTVGGVQRWAMVSGPFIAGLATDYIPGGYVAALALHLPLMIGYTMLILSSKSIKRASDELDREQKLLEPADFEDVPRASQSSSCFTLDTRYTGRREENVNGGWSPSGSCDDIANGVIAVTRVIAVTPSWHVIYEQRRGAESVDDIPSSDRGERNDSDGTDRKDGDRGASVCLIRAPLVTERNSLVNLSRSVYDDGVAANKGVANDDDSYVAVADKRKPPNAFSEI